MTTNDLIAKSSITINAPVDQVWDALINPEKIKKYMFGSTVKSDFTPGSKISFTGDYNGKPFEEKGTILKAEKNKLFSYDSYHVQSGKPDLKENYRTVTFQLTEKNGQTAVILLQDNNESEESRNHSQDNWKKVLEQLKKAVESSNPN